MTTRAKNPKPWLAVSRNVKRAILKSQRVRGYTQAELAARVGVSQATVSRWLSSERIPNTLEAIRLASSLSIKLDDLLRGKTR